MVARHQLGHQEAVLLAVVGLRKQALVLDGDIEVQVTVLLVVANQGDSPRDSATGVENRQAFGVVDTLQRARR